LISQRPSELSAQALSQCGTIFALRLANELDQRFMETVMPDAAHGNLATLSSLGTQEAIVCGDGVPLPMRIRFDDLPRARRPRSEGADFAKAWQTDSADAASETRGCAVGASKAANASPSSDIPILLAAGNPNMDRQRYCRGRRAGDPQSGHIPRGRGADRALSQRPDCRALDFCQFRV
jgi:hypothetical protein